MENIFDVNVEETDSIMELMGVDKKNLGILEEPEEKPSKEIDIEVDNIKVPPKKEEINHPPDSKEIKDKEPSKSSNILSSIVEAIREDGYIDLEEGEELKVETPSDFRKVLDKIKETALESEQSDWSNLQKEYFTALRNGVPHDVIQNHQQKQAVYASIDDETIEDEENDELRKQILMADLMSKNFSQERAAKLIKKFIDSGEDVEEAKRALADLKDSEYKSFKAIETKQKKEREEFQKKLEETNKAFKQYVEDTKEVIPGIPLSPKSKKEVYNALTKPIRYDENGNGVNVIGDFFSKADPQKLFKLAYLLKYTDNLNKLETISPAKAVKAVTSKLDSLLETSGDSLGFTNEEFSSDSTSRKGEELWKSLDKIL